MEDRSATLILGKKGSATWANAEGKPSLVRSKPYEGEISAVC